MKLAQFFPFSILTAVAFFYGTFFLRPGVITSLRHLKKRATPALIAAPKRYAGHLFAIIGTFFIVLLLLYSVRKRFRFAQQLGKPQRLAERPYFSRHRRTGSRTVPYVFKFSGIVSIAFWSMVLVVASGVVGKYIFALIPRSLSGMELNRIEMEAEEIGLTFEMRKLLPGTNPFWQLLTDIENETGRHRGWSICILLFEPRQLRRQLKRMLA